MSVAGAVAVAGFVLAALLRAVGAEEAVVAGAVACSKRMLVLVRRAGDRAVLDLAACVPTKRLSILRDRGARGAARVAARDLHGELGVGANGAGARRVRTGRGRLVPARRADGEHRGGAGARGRAVSAVAVEQAPRRHGADTLMAVVLPIRAGRHGARADCCSPGGEREQQGSAAAHLLLLLLLLDRARARSGSRAGKWLWRQPQRQAQPAAARTE